MKSIFWLSLFAIIVIVFNGCSKNSGEVTIGNQIWMVKNLDIDRYRNGDPIPEVKDVEEWNRLKTGAWCYNENDLANGKKYGKLYNWYAVIDPRGLAPKGYHIPSKVEIQELKSAISDNSNALKDVGQGTGTNTSGFSALLAGMRTWDHHFVHPDDGAGFWSSSVNSNTNFAYYLYMYPDGQSLFFLESITKCEGISVRCIKD